MQTAELGFAGAPSLRRLDVELPGVAALWWLLGIIIRLVWLPFSVAVAGRWAASTLEGIAFSLLALAVVHLGGTRKDELLIPQIALDWIAASSSPVVSALLLALAGIVVGRAVETIVEWCLPWIHLKVNRYVTPEVLEAAVEPSTRRLIDPPTAVQRWLLKIDLSFFIYESLAATAGHLGTVAIFLFFTFKTNMIAGEVALALVILWVILAVPLVLQALRASRRAAYQHEEVGRLIRDSTALRAELNRPSLRAFWRGRNAVPLDELQNAIKWQGIWNVALFGTLGLIARSLPIVALAVTVSSESIAGGLAVYLYLTRMATPLTGLASTFPWLQYNLISVQRLFRLLEETRDRIDTVPAPFQPRSVRVLDWQVRFLDGSRLRFPELEITPGAIVCVVGPSGSGKSSLLDSLAGQVAASGSLLVDGRNVAPGDPGWRESCSLVRQEPELVPGTLFDNLRDFPFWTETPVRKSAVERILATRPLGGLGHVAIDEKGISVGQRRAIAVLRALGSNTPVLLLDEPIAGIDEALVMPIAEAIMEASREGRVILISAHEHDLKRLDLPAGQMAVVRLDHCRNREDF